MGHQGGLTGSNQLLSESKYTGACSGCPVWTLEILTRLVHILEVVQVHSARLWVDGKLIVSAPSVGASSRLWQTRFRVERKLLARLQPMATILVREFTELQQARRIVLQQCTEMKHTNAQFIHLTPHDSLCIHGPGRPVYQYSGLQEP